MVLDLSGDLFLKYESILKFLLGVVTIYRVFLEFFFKIFEYS